MQNRGGQTDQGLGDRALQQFEFQGEFGPYDFQLGVLGDEPQLVRVLAAVREVAFRVHLVGEGDDLPHVPLGVDQAGLGERAADQVHTGDGPAAVRTAAAPSCRC